MAKGKPTTRSPDFEAGYRAGVLGILCECAGQWNFSRVLRGQLDDEPWLRASIEETGTGALRAAVRDLDGAA
jgi:hypothetical protein